MVCDRRLRSHHRWPTLQETLAKQMNANVNAHSRVLSHVAMLSKPDQVASFIQKAAREDR